MSPTIRQQQGRIDFIGAQGLAGTLVTDDPFKPYVCPLRTPAGHDVTLAMPSDHRHHKGLMYALRCEDLNFWEEADGSPLCGVQRVSTLGMLPDGIELELLWQGQDGTRGTYREHRSIRCRMIAATRSFRWTWTSIRTALRPHRLIQSEWSMPTPDGRRINYHGLGIRLPWAWAFNGDTLNGTEIDGTKSSAEEALGTTGPEIAMWGFIDGHWNPPCARVTLRQKHGFAWFALKGDFPYLSVGPSNAGPVEVAQGQTFSETYEIEVSDLPERKPA